MVRNLEENYTTKEHSRGAEKASLRKFEKVDKDLNVHGTWLDRLDRSLQESMAKVETKTDIRVTDGLKEDLKRHALYDDLKELYEKTLTPIKTFQDAVSHFRTENEQMKAIIRQFDQTISKKASKVDINNLKAALDRKPGAVDLEATVSRTQRVVDGLRDEIGK